MLSRYNAIIGGPLDGQHYKFSGFAFPTFRCFDAKSQVSHHYRFDPARLAYTYRCATNRPFLKPAKAKTP